MSVSVVCWKWLDPHFRTRYTAEHVNVLRAMVARHYSRSHRFICVTDNAKGLDPRVEVVPIWNDHAGLGSPYGPSYPSCYRRLKAFSPDAGKWFGERFISIDLDTVIVNDITPIVDRSEDFVMWGQSDFRKQWYNGSLWMLTSGSRPQVWTQFDPRRSPMLAKQAGARGSDQGWISYILGPHEAKFSKADGVYSYRVDVKGKPLPADARIVAFHGHVKQDQVSEEWVLRHYTSCPLAAAS